MRTNLDDLGGDVRTPKNVKRSVQTRAHLQRKSAELSGANQRGLTAAVQYSTVLYVEDMSGLNDGTVYDILTVLASGEELGLTQW